MTTKSLVEGECGRPNALVALARTHVQGTSSLTPSSVRSSNLPSSSLSLGDKFAREYLREKGQSSRGRPTFHMGELTRHLPAGIAAEWADEFVASPSVAVARQWSDEFASSNAVRMHDAWNRVASTSSTSALTPTLSAPLMWPSEYLEKFDEQSSSAAAIGDSWASEFLQKKLEEVALPPDDVDDEFVTNMETEWDSLQRSSSWASLEYPSLETYQMESDNPYLNEPNLIEKGNELLMNGDLASSILHFEAAAQNNPTDVQAWLLLGLSQAENEQDFRAIAAFRKALEVDPKNLEALLALSVSYANENMEGQALNQLERWLEVHPVYGSATVPIPALNDSFISSFIDQAHFQKVEDQFLSAARLQPIEGDAELQNALGVLYNLNRNFDRAIDSLKAALSIRPNDARLWNRLGATLANGERTVEAISAYRQALEIFPSYVRARYNLGISCMHLESYNEAMEHLLCALELQSRGGGPTGSSSIWPTLRSVVIRGGGERSRELLAAVEARDLDAFAAFRRTSLPPSLLLPQAPS